MADHPDEITFAKFRPEIFRGHNFTGGPIFQFSIDVPYILQHAALRQSMECKGIRIQWISKDRLKYL